MASPGGSGSEETEPAGAEEATEGLERWESSESLESEEVEQLPSQLAAGVQWLLDWASEAWAKERAGRPLRADQRAVMRRRLVAVAAERDGARARRAFPCPAERSRFHQCLRQAAHLRALMEQAAAPQLKLSLKAQWQRVLRELVSRLRPPAPGVAAQPPAPAPASAAPDDEWTEEQLTENLTTNQLREHLDDVPPGLSRAERTGGRLPTDEDPELAAISRAGREPLRRRPAPLPSIRRQPPDSSSPSLASPLTPGPLIKSSPRQSTISSSSSSKLTFR